jgi:REP element-mobilizing transposase RayT
LLKVSDDRRRWLFWVREAKKRFRLCVLDYCVTNNHIHLLVKDTGGDLSIARSIQLIAGRTAQEYNERKNRKGAFWEDRYHATAVQSGEHLKRCLTYIDLNMVRAGVVNDPSLWEFGGFADIQNERLRNQVVDYTEVMALLNVPDFDSLKNLSRRFVEDAMKGDGLQRQQEWSESLAVGTDEFVSDFISSLKDRTMLRDGFQNNGPNTVREEAVDIYKADFAPKIASIEAENELFWDFLRD